MIHEPSTLACPHCRDWPHCAPRCGGGHRCSACEEITTAATVTHRLTLAEYERGRDYSTLPPCAACGADGNAPRRICGSITLCNNPTACLKSKDERKEPTPIWAVSLPSPVDTWIVYRPGSKTEPGLGERKQRKVYLSTLYLKQEGRFVSWSEQQKNAFRFASKVEALIVLNLQTGEGPRWKIAKLLGLTAQCLVCRRVEKRSARTFSGRKIPWGWTLSTREGVSGEVCERCLSTVEGKIYR